MKDSNESGPVEVIDSIVFVLDGQPATIEATPENGLMKNGVLKFAGKDAAELKIKLESRVKGVYRAAVSVWGEGGNLLLRTPDFLVAFFVS